MKFDYNDYVRIKSEAPEMYRPGKYGYICGWWNVATIESMNKFNIPLNTLLYTVEHDEDVTDNQVPEEYIELIEKYENNTGQV